MKVIISLVILLSITSAYAKESLSLAQRDHISRILEDLIQTTHHLLSSYSDQRNQEPVKINLLSMKNPSYFFKSNFGDNRFFLGRPSYKIHVNPIVFQHNIPDEALEAILAHELVHTEDYREKSSLDIVGIGLKVLFKKSRSIYERQTDLKTILKGYARGLITYREWQYRLLSKTDLAKKKREYLTPNEIRCIEKIRDKKPELIEKWLKGQPIVCEY